jgi:hypothetical protein
MCNTTAVFRDSRRGREIDMGNKAYWMCKLVVPGTKPAVEDSKF